MTILTKSQYRDGLRCGKLVWHRCNEPSSVPPPSAADRARMKQGTAVGKLAHGLYPDGMLVGVSDGEIARRTTTALLGEGKPIFEAAFEADGLSARVDILVPTTDGAWNIVEVKSSTEVKDEDIDDVAFQQLCLSRCGLKIDRVFLLHLNKNYVRRGDIEVSELFTYGDVTDRVGEKLDETAIRARELLDTLDTRHPPSVRIGTFCKANEECPMKEICWSFLPDDNVTQLVRVGPKAFDLLERWKKIVDVPPDRLSEKHLIQQATLFRQEPHLDVAPINSWLSGLEYPLHFLDFETIDPAVPMFDESSPYQKIPFQFSLVILDGPAAIPRTVDFLADAKGDPRPDLVEALKAIGPTGPILAYNCGFERGVVKKLFRVFPGALHLAGMPERIEEMAEPFRKFWAYHPAQQGSWSMKKVLPAWTGTGYGDLDVSEGLEASRQFLKMADPDLPGEERAVIRESLLEYCRQDTMGMVEILRQLREMVRERERVQESS